MCVPSRLLVMSSGYAEVAEGDDDHHLNTPSMANPFLGGEDGEPTPPDSFASPTWGQAMVSRRRVPKGTVKAATFVLISTIMGGGVLSLPWVFAIAGIGLGGGLLLLIACTNCYSLQLLISASRRTGAATYEECAIKAFGPAMGVFVSSQVLLVTLIGLCGYCVLLGDLLPPVLQHIGVTLSSDLVTNRRLIVAVCLALDFPLTLLKNIGSLRFTSFFSVLSIGFLGFTIVYKSVEQQDDRHTVSLIEPILFARVQPDLILAFPVLACSFICHFNILPLHGELRNPTRKRAKAVIYGSIGLAFSMYFTVALFGYLAFRSVLLTPANITSGVNGGNILTLYPIVGDPLITAGRVGLVGTLLLSYPVILHPCRNELQVLAAKLMALLRKCCCSSQRGGSRKAPGGGGNGGGSGGGDGYAQLPGCSPAELHNNVAGAGLPGYQGPPPASGASESGRPDGQLHQHQQQQQQQQQLQQGAAYNGAHHGDQPASRMSYASSGSEAGKSTSASKVPCLVRLRALAAHVLLTAGITGIAFTVSAVVPDIIIVWSICGSTVAIAISYVVPAAIYLRVRPGTIFSKAKFPAFLLLVIGTIMFFVCTISSVNNAIDTLTAHKGHAGTPGTPANGTKSAEPRWTAALPYPL